MTYLWVGLRKLASLRECTKWGITIASWVAIILANTIVSGWVGELLTSLAFIGFIATLCFYVTDR